MNNVGYVIACENNLATLVITKSNGGGERKSPWKMNSVFLSATHPERRLQFSELYDDLSTYLVYDAAKGGMSRRDAARERKLHVC